MKVKKSIKRIFLKLKEKRNLLKYSSTSPGTFEWLIKTEIKYGGIISEVPRNKVSSKDPRSKEELERGGMVGGDRMLHHNYGRKYAEYLLPHVNRNEHLTLAEFGILKGTGLAIWCDLFPFSRILGFDIDLEHIKNNMDNLRNLGAFAKNQPELYEFDQFLDNTAYLGKILPPDKIDICIDDGYHSNETILSTMKSVMPYLSAKFVYFIEDNKEISKEISAHYPNLIVDSEGELTVITRSEKL